MASKLHIRLGTIRNYSHDGTMVPVFTGIDDNETIDVTDSNLQSALTVTAEHVAQAGGENRLLFRVTVHGDRAVRIARGGDPNATGDDVDVFQAGSVEFVGGLAVGDKLAVVNQADPS